MVTLEEAQLLRKHSTPTSNCCWCILTRRYLRTKNKQVPLVQRKPAEKPRKFTFWFPITNRYVLDRNDAGCDAATGNTPLRQTG